MSSITTNGVQATGAAEAPAEALRGTTWTVDVDHTTLEFRVRHAGIAKVRGVFREFEGTLTFDGQGAATASGSVEVASRTRASPPATSTCAARTSSTSSTIRA